MLRVERQELLKKTFAKYIDPEDADVFYFYRQNTLDNNAQQSDRQPGFHNSRLSHRCSAQNARQI